MRLNGTRYDEGTIWPALGGVVEEMPVPRTIVVPHDVIATQHGIATVLQDFGAPFLAGISCWEPLWVAIGATSDEEIPS
jgi:hypothetical protein